MPHSVYSFGTWNLRAESVRGGSIFWRWLACCALLLLPRSIVAAPNAEWSSNAISIAQLKERLPGVERMERTFQLDGYVRASVGGRDLLALQDDSGAALLELPLAGPALAAGQRVVIKASRCILTRTRYGVRISAVPVVENDGLHSEREASGQVHLDAGLVPIQVEWFNGPAEFSLTLEYMGPGGSRLKIPGSALWNLADKKEPAHLLPGVRYRAYEASDWSVLPDFLRLNPVREGVATNFTAAYRTRNEDCGLVFDGLMEISHPGLYTFYLTSDDGSRLYLGRPALSCEVVSGKQPAAPSTESLEEALTDRDRDPWIEVKGEVAYVSQNERGLEMELVVGGSYLPVSILEATELFPTNLLHKWVRLSGICEFSHDGQRKGLTGIFVPSTGQVEILDQEGQGGGRDTNKILAAVAQIRTLKPAEAAKSLTANVRGVVIYASPTSIVLRDATGGIFIGCRAGHWPQQPGCGELWDVEGTTDPGQFSPVIIADKAEFLGYAPLPEPIQPTLDQLMNGNLDAEYAELHGVLTSISTNEMTLLTPDGKVTVIGAPDRPRPPLPESIPGNGPLVGSVVRIRGCFATLVDLQTRQVIPAKVYIYPALVEMEDPSPLDPFSLPTRQPKDLMWFNARASALLRTKLAGQVIYAAAGEYFVWDGQMGYRVIANGASVLDKGDLIEAVGFPKLGGPSPVLQEAQIRKLGHLALPQPVEVPSERLLDRGLDSTLVKMEATLISDGWRQGARVLELQDGPRHFVARMRTGVAAPALLPAGCRLELNGVYASADEGPGQLGVTVAPFELLLNSNAGIRVLQWPPWWTARRAAAVAAALAGLLCVAFIWVAQLRRKVEERTAQLKKQIEERQLMEQRHAIERERARVAQDLHDELGAGLTEVSMLGSLANTPAIPPEMRNRYLDQITQMARSLVSSLDEIVWAVNPNYDSVGSLVSYFSLFADSFLSLAGITCRFKVAENIPEGPLDSKQRHGIFCAFKEALNNAIRHSKATEVRIHFGVAEGEMVLAVIDNGCGFEFIPRAPGRDGLSGISQRMQQLGGCCHIVSRAGQGTRIELRLPLTKTQHGQSRNR